VTVVLKYSGSIISITAFSKTYVNYRNNFKNFLLKFFCHSISHTSNKAKSLRTFSPREEATLFYKSGFEMLFLSNAFSTLLQSSNSKVVNEHYCVTPSYNKAEQLSLVLYKPPAVIILYIQGVS